MLTERLQWPSVEVEAWVEATLVGQSKDGGAGEKERRNWLWDLSLGAELTPDPAARS